MKTYQSVAEEIGRGMDGRKEMPPDRKSGEGWVEGSNPRHSYVFAKSLEYLCTVPDQTNISMKIKMKICTQFKVYS